MQKLKSNGIWESGISRLNFCDISGLEIGKTVQPNSKELSHNVAEAVEHAKELASECR